MRAVDDETVLEGGNSNVVVKVGATVRRLTGPHSEAVQFLLRHLELAGFAASPRFLGLDERGREILTFIDGTVGNYPMEAGARSLEALESAIEILRALHDTTEGLQLPPGYATHQVEGTTPEVVCHWDAAPYNYVFRGSRAAGLIDFDNAGPGRRIDDLAYFAYRFAPLCDVSNLDDGGWAADVDRHGRLHRMAELYPDPRWPDLPDLIITRLQKMKDWILSRVEAGDPAFVTHVENDHCGIYSRDQAFVDAARAEIIAAVDLDSA